MSAIKATILGTGVGVCALTQKEGEGLTVAFEAEPPAFLSWKSFKQLLSMKAAQNQPKPPTAVPVTNSNPA